MKEVKYAKRMMVEGGSEISDILALTAKPEVISFAGGLPAPELFPVADMKRMANEVLVKQEPQHFNILRLKVSQNSDNKQLIG